MGTRQRGGGCVGNPSLDRTATGAPDSYWNTAHCMRHAVRLHRDVVGITVAVHMCASYATANVRCIQDIPISGRYAAHAHWAMVVEWVLCRHLSWR